jgi:ElaB/YqjD/DUF883 family membrane-anchored ribosome-binding protein
MVNFSKTFVRQSLHCRIQELSVLVSEKLGKLIPFMKNLCWDLFHCQVILDDLRGVRIDSSYFDFDKTFNKLDLKLSFIECFVYLQFATTFIIDYRFMLLAPFIEEMVRHRMFKYYEMYHKLVIMPGNPIISYFVGFQAFRMHAKNDNEVCMRKRIYRHLFLNSIVYFLYVNIDEYLFIAAYILILLKLIDKHEQSNISDNINDLHSLKHHFLSSFVNTKLIENVHSTGIAQGNSELISIPIERFSLKSEDFSGLPETSLYNIYDSHNIVQYADRFIKRLMRENVRADYSSFDKLLRTNSHILNPAVYLFPTGNSFIDEMKRVICHKIYLNNKLKTQNHFPWLRSVMLEFKVSRWDACAIAEYFTYHVSNDSCMWNINAFRTGLWEWRLKMTEVHLQLKYIISKRLFRYAKRRVAQYLSEFIPRDIAEQIEYSPRWLLDEVEIPDVLRDTKEEDLMFDIELNPGPSIDNADYISKMIASDIYHKTKDSKYTEEVTQEDYVCCCEDCKANITYRLRLLLCYLSEPSIFEGDLRELVSTTHNKFIQSWKIYLEATPQMFSWDPIGLKTVSKALTDFTDVSKDMIVHNICPTLERVSEITSGAISGVGEDLHRTAETLKTNIDVTKMNLNITSEPLFAMLQDPTTVVGTLLFCYVVLEILGRNEEYAESCRIMKIIVAGVGITYAGNKCIQKLLLPWLVAPQSGEDDDGFIPLVFEGIGLGLFGWNADWKNMKGFSKSLREIESSYSGAEKLVIRVKEWFTKVIVAFCNQFNLSIGKWFNSSNNRLKELQVETNALMQIYIENPRDTSIDFSHRVQRLNMKILDMTLSIPATQPNQPIRMVLQKLSEKIHLLQVHLAESGIEQGERDEGALITIAGAPGVGKTYWCDFLGQHLAITHCREEDLVDVSKCWKSNIYIWPIDGKHHDQYRGQYAVIFPDMFCATDAEGQPSEATFLIYLIGGQPMCLPAAEITKKQRLYVVSSAFVACTNQTYLSTSMFKSIRNIDALLRRVNRFGWYQWVNPKYQEIGYDGLPVFDRQKTNRIVGYEEDLYLYGKLDPSKLPDGETIVDDVYLFRRLNFETGTFVDGYTHSQESFLDQMDQHLDDMKRISDNKRKQLKAQADKLVERRKSRAQAVHTPLFIDEEFEERQAIAAIKLDEIRENERRKAITKIIRTETYKSKNMKTVKRYEGLLFPEDLDVTHPHYDEPPLPSDDEFHDPPSSPGESKGQMGEGVTPFEEWRDNEKNFLKDSYNFVYLRNEVIDEQTHKDLSTDYTSFFNNQHIGPHIYQRNLRFWDYVRRTPKYRIYWYFSFAELFKLLHMGPEAATAYLPRAYMCTQYHNCTYGVLEYLKETLTGVYTELANIASTVYDSLSIPFNWLMGFKQVRLFVSNFCMATSLGLAFTTATFCISTITNFLFPSKKKKKKKEEPQFEPVIITGTGQSGYGTDECNEKFIKKYTENMYLTYFVYYSDEKEHNVRTHISNLLFIGMRKAVTVHHMVLFGNYLATKVNNLQLILVPFGGNSAELSPLKWDWKDIVKYEDKRLFDVDLCVLEFPTGKFYPKIDFLIPPKECLEYMLPKKDIIGVFVQQKTINQDPVGQPQNIYVSMKYNDDIRYSINGSIEGNAYNLGDKKLKTFGLQGLHSSFTTYAGDCASPVFLIDERKNFCVNKGWAQAQQPWLVYLHNSLHLTVPHGTPIYRELFEIYFKDMSRNSTNTIYDDLKEVFQDYEEAFQEAGFKSEDGPQFGNIVVEHQSLDRVHTSICAVDFSFPEITKTEIRRSPLYYLEKTTRFPARLRNYTDKRTGVFTDVMKKAREPYGSNNTTVNADLLRRICQDSINRILNESDAPDRAEVLTLDQALKGDTAHNMAPIDFSTSSGAQLRMWCKHFGIKTKGKRWMQDKDGNLEPKFYKLIVRLVEKAKGRMREGKRSGNIFIDNLKDELLKIEKVLEGKTRLFCSSDFIFLLLCRIYFGAFAGWIYRNRVRNGIAIGVNPYSAEWDAIYDRLCNFADKFLFGDYGKFDKRQLDILMEACLNLTHIYYNDYGTEAYYMRIKLFAELTYSLHMVCKDGRAFFYEWMHGNTSGNFLTAIINSIVNICIQHIAHIFAFMIYTYGKIVNHYDFEMIADTFTYIVLGDDIAESVRERPWNGFNTLSKIIKDFLGLEFTDEMKVPGRETPNYRTIEDGTFLGRRFYKVYITAIRKILSPLRIYSVIECALWIKGTFSNEIEIAKFEGINLELSQHPIETFMKYVPRFAEACRKQYGRYPKYTDFETARNTVVLLSSYAYSFGNVLLEDMIATTDSDKFNNLVSFMQINCKSVCDNTLSPLFGAGEEQYTITSPLVEEYSTSSDRTDAAPEISGIIQSGKGSRIHRGGEVAESSGPIAAGLKKVEKFASNASHIPLLTNLSKDLEWAAGHAANLASAFGWSKPRSNDPITIVNEQDFRYLGTSDGPNVAYPGGVTCLNRIEPIDHGSITNEDEMSLKYLFSIPNFVSTASWAYNTTGQLYGAYITPLNFRANDSQVVGGKAYTYDFFAPLGYIVNHHQFWRGSIIFTMKFVKTQMHSGRLQVTFVPLQTLTALPTASTSTLALRAIVDIREEEEVSFALPYLLVQDYIDNRTANPYMGYLDVTILNELRAPETCSQSIDVQMFFRAGSDFEVAVPMYYQYGNVPYEIQMNTDSVALGSTSLGGESNTETITTTQFMEDGIGDKNTAAKVIRTAKYISRDHDITDFLRKPQLLTSGQWTGANAQGITLASSSVATNLTTTTYWAEKLKGFNLIKGDFVIRVEINASPFQQGKLILHYMPCYADHIARNANYGKTYSAKMIQVVQHPHVEIDARRTFKQLRIPYIAPTEYYSLKDARYDWGNWFLTVFAPLLTGVGGTTSIDYLIYGWFENVELAAPIIPQMNTSTALHGVDDAEGLGINDIGGMHGEGDTLVHARQCIGEKIESIKTLMLRANVMYNYNAAEDFTNKCINPYIFGCVIGNAGATFYMPKGSGDLISYYQSMFCFYRGGMNVWDFSNTTTTAQTKLKFMVSGRPVTSVAYHFFDDGGTSVPSNFHGPALSATAVYPTVSVSNYIQTAPVLGDNNPNNMRITVPYYNQYPMSLTVMANGNRNTELEPSTPRSKVFYQGTIYGATAISTPTTVDYSMVQRSVGDDFQSLFFVACPPLLRTVA